MSLNRREFMQALAFASAGGMSLQSSFASAQSAAQKFYNLPKFGNVHLLHFTDCHAQLLPIYFREPNVNLGIGSQYGKEPHLVGEAFLKANGIKSGTRDAHAFTYLDFAAAAVCKHSFGCVVKYVQQRERECECARGHRKTDIGRGSERGREGEV